MTSMRNRRRIGAAVIWVTAGVVGLTSPGCTKQPPRRTARLTSLQAIGAQIERSDGMTKIDLRNAPEFTDDAVDLVLKEPKVVDLTLQNVSLTDAGVAKFRSLENVGRLILNDTQVTGASLVELEKMPLKNSLVSIGLKNTAIGDDHLAVLTKFPNLARVDLSGTKITDSGLQELSGGHFRMINLHGTQVTEEGITSLKEMYPDADIRQ